jgi:hypothetical protein
MIQDRILCQQTASWNDAQANSSVCGIPRKSKGSSLDELSSGQSRLVRLRVTVHLHMHLAIL